MLKVVSTVVSILSLIWMLAKSGSSSVANAEWTLADENELRNTTLDQQSGKTAVRKILSNKYDYFLIVLNRRKQLNKELL